MKYCSKCGKPLDNNSNYCSSCGIAQNLEVGTGIKDKSLPGIITTLGVITLLGSAFGMLRGLFYQAAANIFENVIHHDEDNLRGYILVFLNFGTCIAAIFMFKLKRIGFYLYLLFQLLYLIFTYYITTFYTNPEENITDGIPLSVIFSAFFWLPSVIMLVLYLTLARKYFKKIRNDQ